MVLFMMKKKKNFSFCCHVATGRVQSTLCVCDPGAVQCGVNGFVFDHVAVITGAFRVSEKQLLP